MKKIAYAAFASVAALALAACGESEAPTDVATESVEMPAEDAMAPATAMPTEPAMGATEAATGAATEAPAM